MFANCLTQSDRKKKLTRLTESDWDSGAHFHWVIQEGFSEEVAFEMTLHYMKEPIPWRSGGRAIQAEEITNAAAWRVKEHHTSVARAERPQEEVTGWVPPTWGLGARVRMNSIHTALFFLITPWETTSGFLCLETQTGNISKYHILLLKPTNTEIYSWKDEQDFNWSI